MRLCDCSLQDIEKRLVQGPITVDKGNVGISRFYKTRIGYSHDWYHAESQTHAVLEGDTFEHLMLLMVFGPHATLDAVIVDAESAS